CRIDDVAANIASRPDVIDGDLVGLVNGDVGDLGEVSEMAEVAGDAHAAAGRLFASGPAGFFGDELENSLEPLGIENIGIAGTGLVAGIGSRCDSEDFELK